MLKAHTAPIAIAILVLAAILLSGGCASGPGSRLTSISMCQSLATSILNNPRIGLANFHVSGRRDQATAFDNMRQAAAGQRSRRSSYQRAPGGETFLDNRMLGAMDRLTRAGWSFRVTELAGGSHSPTSRHYAGTAFDVDYINGVKVGWGNPHVQGFMRACRWLGAREVRGPGTPGHRTHVHVEW